MRNILGIGLGLGLATAAFAGDVQDEVKVLRGQQVVLHVYPFLTDEDLQVLRLVQTNKQALQLFLTSSGGYSAIAVAPNEGFVRSGSLAPSAIAIGDFPDAVAAAEATLAGCEAKRKGGEACVVVMEIGPAS